MSTSQQSARTINFLLLIVLVLDRGKVHCRIIREDQAIRLKVFVAGQEDGIEHRLVEQEIAHPLADDDVELRDREL